MQSPVKKQFITQGFGKNPEDYAKYGLKGHNGLDFRAFLLNGDKCYVGEKSEVFAPHDGFILENHLDGVGYGWYIKIENDDEGSLLGHFSSQCKLPVGTRVKAGQFIGFQGTTGNSTGIHLHWGYYKKPRDKSNGYNGYINQEGLYSAYQEPAEEVAMTHQEFYNKFLEAYRKHKGDVEWGDDKNKPESTLLDDPAAIGRMIDAIAVDKANKEARIKELELQLSELPGPITPPASDTSGFVLTGKTETTDQNGVKTTLIYTAK